MKGHWIWMVIGCGLPLLLIFFAPVFGIKGNLTLFTFIVIMFAVHLLMPMRHRGHSHGLTEDNLKRKSEVKQDKDKEQHQH
ncbi:hypothetical protein ACA086_08450 [Muriicola sp. E247]|uniref:hypothetical protein n=1 Tax=Muriicola sp. E247 TaxID=3242730 RepID=UPI0035237304